ncbi:MAG: stage II sporulation protein R [Clostridium sp.]
MRKKIVILIIVISLISLISILTGCVNSGSGQGIKGNTDINKTMNYEEIENEIIRFHVLANSDTEEDQGLKLKVRDEVINRMAKKLSGCNNIDEAREILYSSTEEVKAIASDVIKKNGYNYSVTIELARENFPDKMYGDTLFPQGNYEAFRILIGEASGQNWWCVMFPPLCFVDETKQAINSKDTKESIEEVIKDSIDSTDSSENIGKSKKNKSKPKEKVKFKSKIWELFTGK